ncbi:MAG: hypothetical protein AAGM67_01205 [Bacteroidota bacterium]
MMAQVLVEVLPAVGVFASWLSLVAQRAKIGLGLSLNLLVREMFVGARAVATAASPKEDANLFALGWTTVLPVLTSRGAWRRSTLRWIMLEPAVGALCAISLQPKLAVALIASKRSDLKARISCGFHFEFVH